MIFKENYQIEYIELIKAIGKVVPVCDYATNKITLRHDVDHDLEHAFLMASIEYKNNIQSTYYILPPEFNKKNYYGQWVNSNLEMSMLTKLRCLEMQNMGHEIGLHSNLVTLCKQSGQTPEQIMEYVLNDFESAKLNLVTTASHGDSGARKGGYINYNVWQEMGVKEGIQQIKLSDYGLTEAYNLKRINYLSDSGGKFALCGDEVKRNVTDKTEIFEFISKLKKPSQILIHPIWWS